MSSNNNDTQNLKTPRKHIPLFFLFALAFAAILVLSNASKSAKESLGFSQIMQAVRSGNVENLVIHSAESRLVGRLRATDEGVGSQFNSVIPTEELLTRIVEEVENHNKEAQSDALIELEIIGRENAYLLVLLRMLPWLLIAGVIIWFIVRQSKGMGQGGMQAFGRSGAKLVDTQNPAVTFKDVAGVEEAREEVYELIEFLRDPAKFQRLGGRIPRGVLLVGPPGTGKTLLAKAVAGEAGVPFYSICGSDFVEMFVGVGAARVRDLFRQGREHSPCIIFLDEIDAVGRKRGAQAGGGSEEREQTLNAILVEMDGFASDSGVIVIAATNRPDVLDPALLRPGRFDREIIVDLPDVVGREKILEVHSREVPLSADVDLSLVARGTPSFSGADLQALINEAALIAAREGLEEVQMAHCEEARDKVCWGRAKKSRVMDPEERRVTAYHEAGHAILTHLIDTVEPLHKVTIIPRGPSLGSTMSLPLRDIYQFTRSNAHGQLMVLLGGRIAEEKFCGEITSGASNDLQRASKLAFQMVCEWGMSSRVGCIVYREESSFMGGEEQAGIPPLGQELRNSIDNEIRSVLNEAYREAEELIESSSKELIELAEALLERETLSGEEVAKLFGEYAQEACESSVSA